MTALPPALRQPAAVQTLRWILRPMQLLDDCERRFGDVFLLRMIGVGSLVIVSAPDVVKQVFTADADVLHAGEGNSLLRPMLGEHSMLTLDGAPHLRQRRLLLPAFHGERMRAYADVMRELTEATFATWPIGTPFALHPFMQMLTLDVILRTVFGVEAGAQQDRLRDVLVRLVTMTANPYTMVPAMLQIDVFRRFPRSRLAVLKRELDAAVYDEIARRRRAPTGGADVLSMMIEARDDAGGAMTDVEIRDELVTLLFAGHETTATALAWAFERLLANPPTLERLRADLAAGRDEYLDAVIKETLRARPIVPLVARQVKQPFRIREWTIPPGLRITPCIYLANRRADAYPDPEAFRPERWLGTKPDPYLWLPFGGGIRRCLGQAFAMFEMRVVLQTIIPRARLRLADGPATVVRRNITLAPSGGTRVVLDERTARAAAA